MAAQARLCWGSVPQVWEGSGPTVLDALAAIIDALARDGHMNPIILGMYVWDDPDFKPGDDRVVVLTTEN